MASVASAIDVDSYLRIVGPPADATYKYGPAPSQVAELFRPDGKGPFPVAILIHGGCWQAHYGGLQQFRALAASLKARGIAVWNVEYRRIDEPGGGYPGTYQDIAAALDSLSARATTLNLDLTRAVAFGHSAGADLALWAASRGRLPQSSTLYESHPLIIPTVISAGGLPDLQADADQIARVCGVQTTSLTGAASVDRPDVFSDTSPQALLPSRSHSISINGEDDHIAPASLARRYANAARQASDDATTLVIPGAGHFDEVDPNGVAWRTIEGQIINATGKSPAAIRR